ncbi:unnamed protein product [Adineta steineri]|uniref:NAD(P)(+)--arginine ADP-ribosyltransferase n=1 Tax=Adineta steineri TaxID=433720 RepID=A0A814WMW4_9BILA|nr:unnamed protein product [Adineta steineri]CAF1474317.1 unnamed protein product [Adineta steineri]
MATSGEDEYFAQRVLRLTDIAQEPMEFLTPITGYEKMPIVSLEEAVEPLVSILPTVKSHAYAAKKRCKKPADNLTQDESASIMLYSMGWEPLDECLYCALNATLRSENRTKLKPWFLFLRLFLAALFRLPSIPHLTVFRGVKSDLSQQFKKNETFVWWGFSSCTTSIDVLQSDQFLGMEGTRTMFTIHCNSARDIRKHSYYPSEEEVLLLAATEFQVKGNLNQGHGLRTIQLQEVQSDHPMLIPVSCANNSVDLTAAKLKNLKVKDEASGNIDPYDALAEMEAMHKCCKDIDENVESITLGEFGLEIEGRLMDPRWDKNYVWSSKDSAGEYWENPRNQGGKPYYCPSGWKRFGIKVATDGKEFDAKWGNWNTTYHGTSGEFASSIITSGLKVRMRGCYYAKGIPRVYVSPSIEYSAHPRHAYPWKKTTKNGETIWYQLVFQCRVNPRSIHDIRPETFLDIEYKKKVIDPNFENNELVWIILGREDQEFTQDNIICYGMMIRTSKTHPKTLKPSKWWEYSDPHCYTTDMKNDTS